MNANVGWLGTSGGLARTTDGGANWISVGTHLVINNATIAPYNAFVPLNERRGMRPINPTQGYVGHVTGAGVSIMVNKSAYVSLSLRGIGMFTV